MAEAASTLSAPQTTHENDITSLETPLQHVGSACQQAIESCQAFEPLMRQQWARNRLIDFNLWAASVGLFAGRKNALDYRLAQYPDVSRVLLSLMSTLADLASRLSRGNLTSASTGAGPAATEGVAGDDSSPLSISPWSSDQNSSRSSLVEQARDAITPLDNALTEGCKDIESLMDRLLDLGTLIRGSGQASRLFKADMTFKEEAYAHLQRHLDFMLRFANLQCTTAEESKRWDGSESTTATMQEWWNSLLRPDQVGLITANLKRRHRFAYARKRATTLASSKKAPLVDLPPSPPAPTPPFQHILQEEVRIGESTAVPTQISASVAEEQALQFRGEAVEAGIVDTDRSSAASTDVVLMSNKLRYPNAPRISSKRAFKCPCCSQVLPKRTGTNPKAWR